MRQGLCLEGESSASPIHRVRHTTDALLQSLWIQDQPQGRSLQAYATRAPASAGVTVRTVNVISRREKGPLDLAANFPVDFPALRSVSEQCIVSFIHHVCTNIMLRYSTYIV